MKWWKPVVVGLSLTLAPGLMQPAQAGKKNPAQSRKNAFLDGAGPETSGGL